MWGGYKLNNTKFEIFLLCISIQKASSENSFEVAHYQFKDWPDHSVPECAGELLSFIKEAVTLQEKDTSHSETPDEDVTEGPILVHCR